MTSFFQRKEIELAEEESLSLLLKKLKPPFMQQNWEVALKRGREKGWSSSQYLSYLCEEELSLRYERKIARYKKESRLPSGKSFRNFNFKDVAIEASKLKPFGEEVSWIKERENLLLFGPSGVGKTHLAAAIGDALVEKEVRVKFYRGFELVQELQKSKKELSLQRQLEKLEKYELLIIDDLGYVKKDEQETSVLFELISRRYERGSLLLTSNLAFGKWDSIFGDEMMAVAAIDRLVHHAQIIEISGQSYRRKEAEKRKNDKKKNRQK